MRNPSTHCGGVVLIGLLVALAAGSPVQAGTVKHVTTWSQLWNAVVTGSADDEIIIYPGVYNVTNSLYMINCPGLILRGSTGDPNDVILRGPGMNNAGGNTYEGVQFVSADMTLADLTVEEFFHHGVHYQASGDGCVVDNVIVRNCGEQYIKGTKFIDDVIIRNTQMIQTKTRLDDLLPYRPNGYTGGIDLHGARNFHIVDTIAIDIFAEDGYGDAGIFLWNETSNGIIERNVVIGCNKGIALGNPSNSLNVIHARDVIVRNNFVARGPSVGVELCFVQDISFYNNTVYGADGNYFRAVQLLDDYNEVYFPMTGVELAYNIIRGQIRDITRTQPYTLTGNIVGTTATANWFVAASAGDLHLTALATPAIDSAVTLIDVPEDIDGQARPIGSAPDVGADEFAVFDVADLDSNFTVDLIDYAILLSGMQGPGQPEGVAGTDLDQDGDCDMADYAVLARGFTGP